MKQAQEGDQCGKCGAGIDSARRVDYTLKDGTRVCETCFIKGTAKAEKEKFFIH